MIQAEIHKLFSGSNRLVEGQGQTAVLVNAMGCFCRDYRHVDRVYLPKLTYYLRSYL